jgi:hypothetical protein
MGRAIGQWHCPHFRIDLLPASPESIKAKETSVSSARTDEVLKVIVANPTMIKAYKAGVPGNGQPFPDGSMIVKLQWKPKKH